MSLRQCGFIQTRSGSVTQNQRPTPALSVVSPAYCATRVSGSASPRRCLLIRSPITPNVLQLLTAIFANAWPETHCEAALPGFVGSSHLRSRLSSPVRRRDVNPLCRKSIGRFGADRFQRHRAEKYVIFTPIRKRPSPQGAAAIPNDPMRHSYSTQALMQPIGVQRMDQGPSGRSPSLSQNNSQGLGRFRRGRN